MIPAMNVSLNGLEKLKDWEGCVLRVYKDSAGLPTIGIGHLLAKSELLSGYLTIKGVSVPFATGITEQQALDLLDQDLDQFEWAVNKKVSVPLAQNQFDALVAFAFNIGVGGFTASSALKAVNSSNLDEVPNLMQRWNKITDPKTGQKVVCEGLVSRRNKEIALFLS